MAGDESPHRYHVRIIAFLQKMQLTYEEKSNIYSHVQIKKHRKTPGVCRMPYRRR